MELIGATALYIAFVSLFFLRQELISPGLVFSLSLLLPVLLFRVDLGIYASFVFLSSALLFFFCSTLGQAIPLRLNSSCNSRAVNPYFVYILFVMGFGAFLVNISRVFGELGYLAYFNSDSKSIELAFGRHTAINYVFFMLMIVPSLALIAQIRSIVKVSIVLVSLACLTLNGIKSTFLFALAITVFTYMQVAGVTLRRVVLVVPVLCFFITLMFAFVNMGGSFQLANYIDLLYGYAGVNYKNFELELSLREDFTLGKYTFFFLTKLIEPKYVGGYYASNDFNLLNVDYNMGTVLREFYVDFGLLGMFFIISVLGFFSGFVYKFAKAYGGVYYIVSAIFLTACLFSFFGNQFIRLQFIWLFMILAFIFFASGCKYVRN